MTQHAYNLVNCTLSADIRNGLRLAGFFELDDALQAYDEAIKDVLGKGEA